MLIIMETALNNSQAGYLNMGGVSMLQVAARRLQRMWPSARICGLTAAPEDLNCYVPWSRGALARGRDRSIRRELRRSGGCIGTSPAVSRRCCCTVRRRSSGRRRRFSMRWYA